MGFRTPSLFSQDRSCYRYTAADKIQGGAEKSPTFYIPKNKQEKPLLEFSLDTCSQGGAIELQFTAVSDS